MLPHRHRIGAERGASHRVAGDSRSIAIGVIGAIAFYVSLLFLWAVRDLVLVMMLGVMFGVTLAPVVDLLGHHRIPRALSAILIVVGVLAAVGLLAWLVAPEFTAQVQEVEKRMPEAVDRIQHALESRTIGGLQVSQSEAAAVRRYIGTHGIFGIIYPFVKSVTLAIAGVVLILFLGIYVSAESRLYHAGLVRLVPPRKRERVEKLLLELASIVRRWLIARLLAMAMIGVATGVALWAIGIPASTALGLITGVLEFIPYFGPIASAVPAVAMGLVISPMKAVWVIVLFIVLQHIESDIVSPLIMRNRIAVPPLATIFAVAALGLVFGLPGMLISEPLTAIVIVSVRALYVEPMERSAAEGSRLTSLPAREVY